MANEDRSQSPKGQNDGTDQVVNMLRTYLKLCTKSNHRSVLLKDANFLKLLTTLLSEKDSVVMVHIVKILLYLTENADHRIQIAAYPGIIEAVSKAADGNFAPSLLHNLVVVSSRLRNAHKVQTAAGDCSNNGVANKIGESHGTVKKFMSRKSRQFVFEFDELDEELKSVIERKLLTKKGVISVCFNVENLRVTIRTILSLEVQDIADVIFDCGCEVITQIVTVDGVIEKFAMYASERQKKTVVLPDYLDDIIEVPNPNSCVVTDEYAKTRSSKGGWFSGITSMFW